MPRISWKFLLGLGLAGLSVFLAAVHYWFFRDARTLAFYLALDCVFIPIQVLFVSFILDSLLLAREKRRLIEKMNMAVGIFFSEVGTDLVRNFFKHGCFPESLQADLLVSAAWTSRGFETAILHMRGATLGLDAQQADLAGLRDLLINRRGFLLRLLQNPNLLEHETFTELLQAVFHLAEELTLRSSVVGLSDADYSHLSGDMERVAGLLVTEWLAYMNHLSRNYPYLFSLAVRTNPFNAAARVEIPAP
jgi:hypothetical protein